MAGSKAPRTTPCVPKTCAGFGEHLLGFPCDFSPGVCLPIIIHSYSVLYLFLLCCQEHLSGVENILSMSPGFSVA